MFGTMSKSATASGPGSFLVLLISVALSSAALGLACPRVVMKYSRTSAAHPATSGAAMLVPPM